MCFLMAIAVCGFLARRIMNTNPDNFVTMRTVNPNQTIFPCIVGIGVFLNQTIRIETQRLMAPMRVVVLGIFLFSVEHNEAELMKSEALVNTENGCLNITIFL